MLQSGFQAEFTQLEHNPAYSEGCPLRHVWGHPIKMIRAGHQGRSLDLWAQHSRPSPASGTGDPPGDAGHPPQPCNVTYTSATPVPQQISLPPLLASHVHRTIHHTIVSACVWPCAKHETLLLWTRFGDLESQEAPAFSPGAGAGPQALCHCSSTRPGARYGVGLVHKLSPHAGLHEG